MNDWYKRPTIIFYNELSRSPYDILELKASQNFKL